jgi:hypothetical protein
MSTTLTDRDDGERKIFRDSIVTNASGMCDLLTRLNVTKDPELEKARRMLEQAIAGFDPKDLRGSDGARVELKSSVDDILSKFNW